MIGNQVDVAPAGSNGAGHIGDLIDNGAWNSGRKAVLLLCALAVILDGFDNQILGFAIPAMIAEWGVSRQDFAFAVAIGFVGMTVGTPIGGLLSDRWGRKVGLICSVLIFGVATAAIATAGSVFEVSLYRFIGGLGLGGAMPAATTLIAEFTPLRRRNLAVMLGLVCIPVGGMVGGVIAAQILPTAGWRLLFLIGGAGPLLLAVLLYFALPESAQYLVRREGSGARLDRAVRVLGGSTTASANYAFEGAAPKSPLRSLFTREMLQDTFGLWLAFFACLLPVYVVYAWAPSLLSGAGFDLSVSSAGSAYFNFGGILGSLIGAWLMGRFGSRAGILSMAAGGVLCAVLLTQVELAAQNERLLMAGLFVLGGFLLGVQVALYALAAQVYPASSRATGVGAAAGVGRIGAIVSAYAGTAVVGLGPVAYFGLIAAGLLVTFVAVALVRNHSEPIRASGGSITVTQG